MPITPPSPDPSPIRRSDPHRRPPPPRSRPSVRVAQIREPSPIRRAFRPPLTPSIETRSYALKNGSQDGPTSSPDRRSYRDDRQTLPHSYSRRLAGRHVPIDKRPRMVASDSVRGIARGILQIRSDLQNYRASCFRWRMRRIALSFSFRCDEPGQRAFTR